MIVKTAMRATKAVSSRKFVVAGILNAYFIMELSVTCTRLLLLLVIAATIGCGGDSGLSKAPVTGVVTYRGKPVDVGKIVFFHSTGQATSADFKKDGSFQGVAYVGPNKVAIVSFGPDRPNPNKNHFLSTLPGESLVPRRYTEPNSSSLTFEVKQKKNIAHFSLED